MLDRAMEELPSTTGEELVKKLDPLGRLFSDGRPSHWIFRGVSLSSYKLLPSSLRCENKPLLRKYATNQSQIQTEIDQIIAELNIIMAFAAQLDSLGIQIPGDSPAWRSDLNFQMTRFLQLQDQSCSAPIRDWPANDYVPLYALAQHSGLPTRLLDWSYRPEVAAYFAASGAWEKS